MQLSKIDSPYWHPAFDRYHQGDILRDIILIQWAEEAEGDQSVQIQAQILPYSIVMSQDCDLEQDFKNQTDAASKDTDKYLQSILLCPAYPALNLKEGSHLEHLDMKMGRLNSDQWRQVKSNNNARYHYLIGAPDYQVPDLAVDFKHFFTIPRNVLYRSDYKDKYIATISELFRENLSMRFAQYLSRIGLPDLPL